MGYIKAVFGTEISYPNFATNINFELARNEIPDSRTEIISKDYRIEYYVNNKFK